MSDDALSRCRRTLSKLYVNYAYGMDCSEIAEDLKDTLNCGRICTMCAVENITNAPQVCMISKSDITNKHINLNTLRNINQRVEFFNYFSREKSLEQFLYHTFLMKNTYGNKYIIDGSTLKNHVEMISLKEFMGRIKKLNVHFDNMQFVVFKGIPEICENSKLIECIMNSK